MWNDIFALLNFNIEVATIKSKVSEPMLGAIRLQWWKDAIENLNNDTPNNQILIVLKTLINKYSLDIALISSLLEARTKDFQETPFENVNEIINFISATTYNLNLLILNVLHKPDPEGMNKIIEIIENQSLAYGITAFVRSYNNNLKNGRVIIKNEAEFEALIKIAEDKLIQAKTAIRILKSSDKKILVKRFSPLFLKGKIAEFYLNKIKKQVSKGACLKDIKLQSIEGFGVIKLTIAYLMSR